MIRTPKRTFFRIATGLVPLILLVAAELGLRFAGAFERLPVVFDLPNSGGTLRGFNALVAARYVDPERTTVPMLAPQTFRAAKNPEILRVLCLGESTTAGFPFDCQVPFPAQLRERLAECYPRRHVEVLNAGIAAISSYVVLDMLPELLDTKPDVVVVYMGHNEFYGIYGSGSALVEGGSDLLVRGSLAAQRTRIGRMVKAGLDRLRGTLPATSAERTLMQESVKDQAIPLGSAKYRSTMDNFRRNLERLLAACADREIPVVIGTLVSNTRDILPFRPIVDSTRIRPSAARTRIARGDSLCTLRRWEDAGMVFGDLVRADSGNADAWYGMGRCELARGRTESARSWFSGARDRDGMRFRAASDANTIIRQVAQEGSATLVDFDSLFAASSPSGIVGPELICDHLHPNPRGYAIMAHALCDAILRLRIVDEAPVPDHNAPMPLGVTDLDWDIGLLKIHPIVHEWPFRGSGEAPPVYRSYGDTAATSLAAEYIAGRMSWSQTHQLMAQEYLRRGNEQAARSEYLAVAVFNPEDQWPWRMLAASFARGSRPDLQAAALTECMNRPGPKGMPAYELALARAQVRDLRGAIDAMAIATDAPEFTPEQRKNARFYLAGFLSDVGDQKGAIAILTLLLRQDPNYEPARKFLVRIQGTPQGHF